MENGAFGALVAVERVDEDHFLAPVGAEQGARTYGGQLLAQTLAAAQKTVEPDRPVHSLHGYFLRAGAAEHPLELAVERVRDGRSFSARAVTASRRRASASSCAVATPSARCQ